MWQTFVPTLEFFYDLNGQRVKNNVAHLVTLVARYVTSTNELTDERQSNEINKLVFIHKVDSPSDWRQVLTTHIVQSS